MPRSKSPKCPACNGSGQIQTTRGWYEIRDGTGKPFFLPDTRISLEFCNSCGGTGVLMQAVKTNHKAPCF